ncbi:MAG: MiaB/RimO family radical SAM methylthiotransferase [Candidatus Omnitrophica bacterium]|nr:MiaB/RimO family radical SAM methylthiotransferase [Candidatus Omnitrophota bacterium]
MKPAPRVAIVSLGCPRNLVDSEQMLGRLAASGLRITELADADTAIVNTCAFIEEAKRESIDTILELVRLKKNKRLARVIVCGCLVQRYKDSLAKLLPEVDAFVGPPRLSACSTRVGITPAHFAYLKICEGCVNNCSFCVIPAIKGSVRSLSAGDVLTQVRRFDAARISELNIIGQDITGYGLDRCRKPQLADLLAKILKNSPHIHWVRLLYLYPARISDELLALIRDDPRVCKYIDLPVQHINDRILKAMNRHTTGSRIRKLIEKVRKVIPGVALRTSIIVGFPSETDKEFKELLSFIRETKFERLGAFMYSREEGTRAYRLAGQLPRRVKESRFNRVMQAQQEVSREVNRRFLGSTLEVLIEEKEHDHYLGRTQYDAPEVDGLVFVRTQQRLVPGEFVRARIVDTLEYDLVGEA